MKPVIMYAHRPAWAPMERSTWGVVDYKVYALKDGKKLWDYKTGDWVISSPCLGPDGTVYVGSHDHKVYALRHPMSEFAAALMIRMQTRHLVQMTMD